MYGHYVNLMVARAIREQVKNTCLSTVTTFNNVVRNCHFNSQTSIVLLNIQISIVL